MDVSQCSSNDKDSPTHRWAKFVGGTVAVLTMALPIVMISYYSPSGTNAEPAKNTIEVKSTLVNPMQNN